MLSIGIEPTQGLIYEGSGRWGRGLWPSPILTPAKITFESEGALKAVKSLSAPESSYRFREDYYDPISRIRRGRFYSSEGITQPSQWHVQPHPALAYEKLQSGSDFIEKLLDTFDGATIWNKYIKEMAEQPLVLLGVDERFTIWTIVGVERISTGEELVTLKARSSLGVLPVVKENQIPADHQARINECLKMFADEVHRSAPASVIDRARDAATAILMAHVQGAERGTWDLAKLATKLEAEKKIITASAAKIIARLHSRPKPTEQARHKFRAIREQDAELATQCVGVILCELGWADWP